MSMKNCLMMIIAAICLTSGINAAISSYTFETVTSGSLMDVSEGSTTLISGIFADDVASTVYEIGFRFPFDGYSYTELSANSNGVIQLGGERILGSRKAPATNIPLLAPISGDNSIHATGKVHFKLTGSAPSRILVVEWDQLLIPAANVASGTFCTLQAWLHESGRIDFVYGTMFNKGMAAQNRGIFVSTSLVAGTIVNIATITTTPTFHTTGTGVVNTSFPANSHMQNLSSASNGSRRVFSFIPPEITSPPNAPIDLFPVNGSTVFTDSALQWKDGGGWTQGFILYFGTDNPPSNIVNGVDLGFELSYTPEQVLNYDNTYYWKVVPYNSYSAADVSTNIFYTPSPPISGIWTIDPEGTGENNFLDFASAIDMINTVGVESPGLTLLVPDGSVFIGNLPALRFNTSEFAPILFQRSGGGSRPIIYAGTGTGNNDAIVRFEGCDYVTWDGIDISDNPDNVTPVTMAEFGIFITNSSASNGARNITIKNCNITMGVNTNQTSGVNQNYTYLPNTPLGTCSLNSFYNINITNADWGYYLNEANSQGLEGIGNIIGTIDNGTASIVNCIRGVNANTQKGLLVQNQQIQLRGGNTSTSCYGVYASGNLSEVYISNNLISSIATGTTFNGLYGVYIQSCNTVEITSNVIDGFTNSYNAISGMSLGGIFVYTASSSVISNNSVTNLTSDKLSIYGLYVVNSGTNLITENILSNYNAQSNIRGMYLSVGSTTPSQILSNQVSDIHGTSANAAGIQFTSGQSLISQNLIEDIEVQNQTSIGIHVTGGTQVNISRNQIRDITFSGSGAFYSAGLYLQSGTTFNIHNNFISRILATGSSTLTVPWTRGIWIASGNNTVYNNSVLLNNSLNTGSPLSSVIYISGSTSTSLINNIFINLSSTGSSGKAVAFWKNNSNFNNISQNSDSNVYYVGISSESNLIFFDGSSGYQDLESFQSALYPREASSFYEDVPFVSDYDLHISTGVNTIVSNNGVPLPEVTNDFDGDIRDELNPDIGADEGLFGVHIESPSNVALTWSDNELVLTWFPVQGASYYKVFTAAIPNPASWGEPIAIVSGTSFTQAPIQQRGFFKVVAVSLP